MAASSIGCLLFHWILMFRDMPLATPIAIVRRFAGSVFMLDILSGNLKAGPPLKLQGSFHHACAAGDTVAGSVHHLGAVA